MKKVILTSVIISAMTIMGTTHADVVGASSNINNIAIGTAQSNPDHDGNSDYPGVRVTAADAPFGNFTIAFDTLQTLAEVDATVDGFEISTLNVSDMPPSHGQLGNFDFAQVPNQDVYFGEWTANRSNPTATHTVYYGGKNKTKTMPSRGTATYTVKGINNFSNSISTNPFYGRGVQSLYSGRLKANFANNTLNGGLRRRGSMIIIKSDIDPTTASFNGSAKLLSPFVRDASGNSQGQFFGVGASVLAGIATFDNPEYDTAFGGKKIDNKAKDISNVISR